MRYGIAAASAKRTGERDEDKDRHQVFYLDGDRQREQHEFLVAEEHGKCDHDAKSRSRRSQRWNQRIDTEERERAHRSEIRDDDRGQRRRDGAIEIELEE